MSQLLRDLRYTLRSLARTPSFAILAILTLALGIGANSAIFSVINGVVLKPLGYPQPERLLHITSAFPGMGFNEFWISPPEYFDYRGRVFTPDETVPPPNVRPTVILSYERWQKSYGGRDDIVGQTIDVSGLRRTVIGIMPPGFDFHDARAELWMPVGIDPSNRQNRGNHYLYLVARLAPGVSAAQAQAELGVLIKRWEDEGGSSTGPSSIHVPSKQNHPLQYEPLQREVVGNIGTALGALLAANRQSIPRAAEIGLDARVVAFTAVVVVVTGIVFGLAPMLHLGHEGVSLALKEGGTRTTATMARARVRGMLVVAEVALAVVLVIGAGLMLRSFWNLMQVDSGFDRGRLATFQIVLPGPKYPDMPRRAQFFNDLARQLKELPGVQSAAAMQGLPPLRQVNANDTEIEGWEPTPGGPAQNIDYYQTVTTDYVATMGIPVVSGRAFSVSDGPMTTPVVMINETMARTFYKDRDPIGRRVRSGFGANPPWLTIVGVLTDVKQGGLDQKTGTELYFLHEQGPATAGFAPPSMNIVVRSTLPLERLAPSIRQIVGAMDKSLPIVNLRTMDQVFSDAVSRPRFLSQLLAIFAALALLLAAVGTYGILAYTVTERTREIGIRMALGASRDRVLRMVLRQGLTVTGAGLVIGIAGALALSRLASALLFNVQPSDPATFALVAGFITAVALVACIVPARRATRVDPTVALRDG